MQAIQQRLCRWLLSLQHPILGDQLGINSHVGFRSCLPIVQETVWTIYLGSKSKNKHTLNPKTHLLRVACSGPTTHGRFQQTGSSPTTKGFSPRISIQIGASHHPFPIRMTIFAQVLEWQLAAAQAFQQLSKPQATEQTWVAPFQDIGGQPNNKPTITGDGWNPTHGKKWWFGNSSLDWLCHIYSHPKYQTLPQKPRASRYLRPCFSRCLCAFS